MSTSVFRRESCRLCDGHDLELVLGLTPTPPVDAYVPAGRLGEVQETFPLDVFLCRACGHVQLLDVVDPKILFGSYIYSTSSSPGLVEHFRGYADEVFRFVKPSEGALLVEIGSNDGTLLRFFEERGMRVLGIDPAREIGRKATEAGLETWPAFFTSELARKVRNERGPAAMVAANNVFAHADALADVADGVRHVLASDGVFVFEVSYLLDMIEGMVFDFIYHEHLCYHSVKPLDGFLRLHGMELIDVQRTPVKGGSLRCFAQLAGGPRKASPSVRQMINREDSLGLGRPEIFRSFAAKIDCARTQLLKLLSDLKAQGKTVAGYGASATTTILIYHFNLGDILSFLVDDIQSRQRLFSPGYHIPVLSPQVIYKRKPEYVLVLAWRFAEMIRKRHQAYLDQGGHFIVPLPEIRVV